MINLAQKDGGIAISIKRPRVHGKFIFVSDEKFYLRGVTYGTFRPGPGGEEFPEREVVDADFAQMASAGINTVRVYTVPPAWLLDAALRHGLYVMVGLPWEQHVAFLDDKERVRSIEERVREGVKKCAGHPSILCYAIGNEIPAPIVRWHGAARVECFLKRLYKIAKEEDPGALVTYVNYPSTEYLDLPFVDFLCFNVYLESKEKLESYLARLQNIAGDRPLVLAEIGLDSRRNGLEAQAASLEWQVRTAFAQGCAGTFVFSWTDEWYRGGFDIEDWDFGLTTRGRDAKPALLSIKRAYSEVPSPQNPDWPRISVVVCSFNGGRVIRDCMEGLLRLEYPNFEVIVVDDGSTDNTAEIVREYPFKLIRTENRGLGSARNTGMRAADGEVIAYTDDDARPDPHWLTYLALTFMTTDHAGAGGPNIAPRGDGRIADCVANAPGGPVHVLLSDTVAEHIPGCNSAYRKACLEEIGGWDPKYRAAGDDVDVCWRLQQRGWTIGFSPAAMVWHHRRNSVKTYWKQQIGYGKAESLLEEKWPEKYNAAGHVAWAGRLYGKGLTQALAFQRGRIYQGTWGTALFQSVYEPAQGTLWSLPLMPEWYLVITTLVILSIFGVFWMPLLWVSVPLLTITTGAVIIQAILSAAKASFTSAPKSRFELFDLYALTAFMHMLQPAARLYGRLRHGLTPWRQRGTPEQTFPRPQIVTVWSEQWRSPEEYLRAVDEALKEDGAIVNQGGDFDRWDLEVRGGILGRARALMTVEEHGAGRQQLLFKIWPKPSLNGLSFIILFALSALGASLDYIYWGGHAFITFAYLTAMTVLLLFIMYKECAAPFTSLRGALARLKSSIESRAAIQEIEERVVEQGSLAEGFDTARPPSLEADIPAPVEVAVHQSGHRIFSAKTSEEESRNFKSQVA